MTPAIYHINIKHNITFGPLKIYCKDKSNNIVPLTNWIVYAQARNKSNPGFIDLSPEITDPSAGEITIEFTDSETRALSAGDYNWDMILETPEGTHLGPFIQGRCKIEETITQPLSA